MSEPYDHFLTHRRTRRLHGHDYAAAGWTFVTINTLHRRRLFGDVRQGVMHSSRSGDIARARWADLVNHHPRVVLDTFVVMPDHMHGLIGLLPQHQHPAGAPNSRRDGRVK